LPVKAKALNAGVPAVLSTTDRPVIPPHRRVGRVVPAPSPPSDPMFDTPGRGALLTSGLAPMIPPMYWCFACLPTVS